MLRNPVLLYLDIENVQKKMKSKVKLNENNF